jgi:hypothetical protein
VATSLRLALALTVLGAVACHPGPPPPETRVLWQRAYADQAQAAYGQALADARDLERAVGDLVEQPRPASLAAARAAWVHARASYARTEVFRFAGGPIDAVERLVDAWPIDEGEIDYVVERPFSGMINEPALHPALSAEHLKGVRSFVVGTGGVGHYTGFNSDHRAAEEFKNDTRFGVLEVTLGTSSYEWRFLAVGGTTLVSGNDRCR